MKETSHATPKLQLKNVAIPRSIVNLSHSCGVP
jgi:hypothetical protein